MVFPNMGLTCKKTKTCFFALPRVTTNYWIWHLRKLNSILLLPQNATKKTNSKWVSLKLRIIVCHSFQRTPRFVTVFFSFTYKLTHKVLPFLPFRSVNEKNVHFFFFCRIELKRFYLFSLPFLEFKRSIYQKCSFSLNFAETSTRGNF